MRSIDFKKMVASILILMSPALVFAKTLPFHGEIKTLEAQLGQSKNIQEKLLEFKKFRDLVITENEKNIKKSSDKMIAITSELETYLFMVQLDPMNLEKSCEKSIAKINHSIKKETAQSRKVIGLVKLICKK